MLFPFIGRVRRRRLIVFVAVLLTVMLYLRSSAQYEYDATQKSKYVPASSPEDDMAALQNEKGPAAAQPPPAAPASDAQSDSYSPPSIQKQPIADSPNGGQLAHTPPQIQKPPDRKSVV